ncbi:Hypothetical predicted protein [Olea europaea subsp. europaea]|uniref:Uncharacterized protein n=1 Tax=Olea europaea subsp. europaea TaxID=158383 RepID=A0A8S0Q6F1_OLEEU|nr:Hypothetical predicted protein [Olea europaea subsp. europaea]
MADQDGASVSYHAHGSWFVGQDQSAPPSPMSRTRELPHPCGMARLLIERLLLNSRKCINDVPYTDTMASFPPPYVVYLSLPAACVGKGHLGGCGNSGAEKADRHI